MSRVTMKMIADKMNLSVSTVNRALINKGRISEKTKEEILKTAIEMGYRPNPHAKSLSSKNVLKIAVICPNDLFFQSVIEGIDTYKRENEDYRLELVYWISGMQTVSEQASALRECLKNGVNGVLISPLHPDGLDKEMSRLSEEGIPVITFNNDISSGERVAYIGQNGQVAGALAGELMSMLLKPKSNVALMVTTSAAMGLKQRADSFHQRMAQSKQSIELIGAFKYDDNLESAVNVALNIISSHEVHGIYANNMLGTCAIAYAVNKMNLSGNIITIGHDTNDVIDNFIRDGSLSVTLLQDPFLQGYQSLKLMFEHLYLKKEITNPLNYMRTVVMMQSNLEESDGVKF